MLSTLLLAYPNIDPVIFQLGPFALRWYALAYIGGVLLGWVLVKRLNRTPVPGIGQVVPDSALDDLIPWAIGGIILGGRLGYVLFYKPGYYLENPGEILQIWGGGMSYHGGLLGMFAAMAILSLRRGMKYFALMDLLAVAAPIGLFLGRLANFVNGELYGHATDMPWAMVFPGDPAQLPRHPSQLYEAALEGIALFLLLLWMATRTRARHHLGTISAFYLLGYSAARIAVEFFRLPDDHLGTLALGLTMGQWLSLPLVALGLFLWWKSRRPSELTGTFCLGAASPLQPPSAGGGKQFSSPPPVNGGRSGGG